VTKGPEPPENETESACESPGPADDQGEASSSAGKGSASRGRARGPFTFRLMPETQLNSLLSLADLANRIVPEPPAISTLMSDLSGIVPPSAMLPLPRIEELVLPALRLPDSLSKIDYASFLPRSKSPSRRSHCQTPLWFLSFRSSRPALPSCACWNGCARACRLTGPMTSTSTR